MNIPLEIARAQGKHGIKGAAHGIKGGRPKLELSDEERTKHRQQQKERSRRRNGIRAKRVNHSNLDPYFTIWGKPAGVPLTPEEFAEREPIWNAKVLKDQKEAEQREKDRIAAKSKRYCSKPPVRLSVGRNEPCPCKSGRKFKKCCGG